VPDGIVAEESATVKSKKNLQERPRVAHALLPVAFQRATRAPLQSFSIELRRIAHHRDKEHRAHARDCHDAAEVKSFVAITSGAK